MAHALLSSLGSFQDHPRTHRPQGRWDSRVKENPMRHRPTSKVTNRVRSRITAEVQRQLILRILRIHGQQTREAIGLNIGLAGDSVRPRCCELLRDGAIRISKKLGTTRAGNKAELLKVAP